MGNKTNLTALRLDELGRVVLDECDLAALAVSVGFMNAGANSLDCNSTTNNRCSNSSACGNNDNERCTNLLACGGATNSRCATPDEVEP